MRSLPNIEVMQAVTAQTGVARMKVTEAPFDNVKVRQAIQACLDRSRILEVVYSGLGAAGYDDHVAPVHPEHAELAPPQAGLRQSQTPAGRSWSCERLEDPHRLRGQPNVGAEHL